MYCKKCGNQIDEGTVFCPKCGTRQDGNTNHLPPINSNVNVTSKKKGSPVLAGGCLVLVFLFIICGVAIANMPSSSSHNNTVNNTTVHQTESQNGVVTNSESELEETVTTVEEQKQLIYSENNIYIYFISMESGTFGAGKEFKFYFENNAENSYDISLSKCNINGYTLNTFFYVEVNPNTKANDTMYIYQSMLDENDITDIESVEVSFSIINSDTYTDTFDTDLITLDLN